MSIFTVRSRRASMNSFVLELLVLGLVGGADDHLVDVRLAGIFFRLDPVLLEAPSRS